MQQKSTHFSTLFKSTRGPKRAGEKGKALGFLWQGSLDGEVPLMVLSGLLGPNCRNWGGLLGL